MFGIGGCHHAGMKNHVTTAEINNLKSRVKVLSEKSEKLAGGPFNTVTSKDVKTLKDQLTVLTVKVGASKHNAKKSDILHSMDSTLNKIQDKVNDLNHKIDMAAIKRAQNEDPRNREVLAIRKQDARNDANNGAYR